MLLKPLPRGRKIRGNGASTGRQILLSALQRDRSHSEQLRCLSVVDPSALNSWFGRGTRLGRTSLMPSVWGTKYYFGCRRGNVARKRSRHSLD